MADDRLIYIYIYIYYIYIYILLPLNPPPTAPEAQWLRRKATAAAVAEVSTIFFILYSFVIPCIVYISIYIHIYTYI
jgi:hypothetical protein